MQDSKLILLVKTFDKEDWRWFKKFLLSPYFNNREELLPFFDYLRTQSPKFEARTLKKEKIFQKLFPKEVYDEKRISYLMNYLLGAAERFLAQRQIETQEPLLNNYLLKSLVDRQLNKHYAHQLKNAKKTLDNWNTKNPDYFYYKFQLTEIGNAHFTNQNLRIHDSYLQEMYDNLNQYFLVNALKYSCEMLSREKVLGTKYQFPITDEIISIIEKLKTYIEPLPFLFYQVFKVLSNEIETTHFEELKISLAQFDNQIPSSEKKTIYLYSINHCLQQYSKNRNPIYHVEQSLELYLTGIQQGFLLNKGYLSPWTFKNVVKLAMNLKRYDFTETFIQENYQKLEKEFQEDALHFNLADLYYQKKDYETAQIQLIQVQYSDIFYKIDSRVLLLKIYYETYETEALFSLIASFSIFLKRNKQIQASSKEMYLNFTSLLGQITRTKKDKIPALIEKIKSTNPLTNRKWLLSICKT